MPRPHLHLVAALTLAACSSSPTTSPAPAEDNKPARAETPKPPAEEVGGLAVGAAAPEIEHPATDGSTFSSANALATGPLVLVFYRGHW